MADAGGSRLLRQRVQGSRLQRRHQLLPQLPPQLGDDAAARRRDDRGSRCCSSPAQDVRHPRRERRTADQDDEPVATDLRGVKLFPGAGHWVQQERAGDTNAAIVQFLKDAAKPAKATN